MHGANPPTQPGNEVLITIGFDKLMKFWQVGNQTPFMQQQLQHNPFGAHLSFPLLAIAYQNCKFGILNLNFLNPQQ